MIDPASFLDSYVEGAFTKRQPLDEGDYIGTIGVFTEKSFNSRPSTKDPSKMWNTLTVPVKIASKGDGTPVPEDVVVFDRVLLDLNNQGKLDETPGKNRRLAAYRQATGQNSEGEQWSVRMLQGRSVRIKLKHELWEGEIQERVEAVSAI